MDIDTTVTIGLGLPETGVDLAKLIFSVAQECDSSKSMNFSIDLSSLADEIMLELKILRVQHENPHLSEAEIQQLMNEITAENQRKKEILAAEKAAKREKVKQHINGNAIEGYELAYSLCKQDDSDEAKELAYRMLSQLRHRPVEDRFEICRTYVESLINLGECGNNIAKVYCRMAGLVYPVYQRSDYSLCLSFYEKAYEYIDEPTRMLDEIIGFCNRFRLNDLRAKCELKKKSF